MIFLKCKFVLKYIKLLFSSILRKCLKKDQTFTKTRMIAGNGIENTYEGVKDTLRVKENQMDMGMSLFARMADELYGKSKNFIKAAIGRENKSNKIPGGGD